MPKQAIIITGILVLAIIACQSLSAPAPATPQAATPPAATAAAPTASPKIALDKPIRFAVGSLAVNLEGSVISGERNRYTLDMLENETLDVSITSAEGNAAFTIIGPDGNPLPGTEEGKDTTHFNAVHPPTGSYAILVGSTRGNATFTLSVTVSGEGPDYQAAPPVAPQIAADKPLRFAVGSLSVQPTGTVISGERDRYTLDILEGESLDVKITSLENNAVFTLIGPDGIAIPGTEEGQDATEYYLSPAPVGSYAILVGPTRGNATYTLSVNVTGGAEDYNQPAPTAAPHTAVDKPIRFAVGPMEVTQEGTVVSGDHDRYTLQLVTGESMNVSITSPEGNAVFGIIGPDGDPLPGTEEGHDITYWTWENAVEGQYAILVSSTRGNATYTLSVSVP